QAALREVLGNHVEQAGSYVDEGYFRFDFNHYAAVTKDELARVEELVNAHILAAEAGSMTEMPIEEAKKIGAMALFGEKYGKIVRVVRMGDCSIEFCGGTHIDNTARIGLFKITSESSVAAGVRRIEGTTGKGVLALLAGKDALIADAARTLKVANPQDLSKRAAQLEGELKETKRALEAANAKLSAAKLDAIIGGAKQVGKCKLLTARLDMKPDAARTLCDSIRAAHADMVAVFALVSDGKLNFIACCGADAVKAGAHAGNILREVSAVTGGRGGGRPDSAMSGGQDLSKIDEALAKAETLLPN
ncbi:MAG: alanine--tRNA ligase, partial [Oscillospiraceae bacterium]|nr:alanine--tRNA ligase [Oscillospiraceae bacterium]